MQGSNSFTSHFTGNFPICHPKGHQRKSLKTAVKTTQHQQASLCLNCVHKHVDKHKKLWQTKTKSRKAVPGCPILKHRVRHMQAQAGKAQQFFVLCSVVGMFLQKHCQNLPESTASRGVKLWLVPHKEHKTITNRSQAQTSHKLDKKIRWEDPIFFLTRKNNSIYNGCQQGTFRGKHRFWMNASCTSEICFADL